jgi:hypothetical protein
MDLREPEGREGFEFVERQLAEESGGPAEVG